MARTAIPPLEVVPYTYEPLPTSTSIRVLSVLPERLGNTEITICGQPLIACRLETIDLNQTQNYKALSYTWGNPRFIPDTQYDVTQKWPVNVNRRLLYVNKKLHQALQHLQGWKEVEKEIDQRLEPYQKTLLIESAERGHVEQVRQLLMRGASVRSQDRFGETALHYAAENGMPEVVKLLLDHKASKSILDLSRRTPLDCCLQRKRGQWADVQKLLTESDQLDNADFRSISQVWIDAICINQEDVVERNSQVAMMSTIYRRAIKVIVWLGVADQDTAREAETAARLVERQEGKVLDAEERHVIPNLLRRHTWFSRKWVAQEVVLAKKIEVYCGNYLFNWNLIVQGCSTGFTGYIRSPQDTALSSRTLKYGHVGRLEPGAWALSHLWSIINPDVLVEDRLKLSDILKEGREKEVGLDTEERDALKATLSKYKPTLSQLVIMTWGLDATDPRDKIFALMGTAKKDDKSSSMTVDYRQSIQQVFLGMGRVFIESQSTGFQVLDRYRNLKTNELEPLEGLSFVQPAHCARHHLEKRERPCPFAVEWQDLPTWVPNFDRRLTDMRIYDRCFNACGTTTYVPHDSDPRLLKVNALFVDEIESVEALLPECHKDTSHVWNEPYSVQSWLRMTASMAPVYVTGEHREEVLLRILTADRLESFWQKVIFDGARPDATQIRQSFKRFICKALSPKHAKFTVDKDAFKTLDVLRETHRTSLLPTRSEIEQYHDEEHNDDEIKHAFSIVLALYIHVRGLFTTRRGYFGNGFNTARPGDQVWLLAGARVPFVLRKLSGSTRFELVGEAYVHGLMQGEAATGDAVRRFSPIEIQ